MTLLGRLSLKHRWLLAAALGLVALPFAMRLLGMTTSTASIVVILSIAAIARLNWQRRA